MNRLVIEITDDGDRSLLSNIDIETYAEFINAPMLNKPTIGPLRMVPLLRSVHNVTTTIDVTRTFMDAHIPGMAAWLSSAQLSLLIGSWLH